MALFKKKIEKKEEPKASNKPVSAKDEAVKEVKKETKKPSKKETRFNPSVVRKPWITEKSAGLSSINKYVFIVRPSASSAEIKKAIEGIYNVNVEAVNIINAKKKRRRLGRTIGVRSGFKKAVITIKQGQTIDVIPH